MKPNSTKPEYHVILEWVEKQSSILDLGCGQGELLSLLKQEKQTQTQGIEIDEQAIYRCVAQGLSVVQEDIDAGLSEYGNKTFDYVILSQSFQEVKKPEFVLKEALRVGKKVIVSFPNFAYVTARFQIFFTGKVPVTPSLPYQWYDTPNKHFLSISDFREYCARQNIRIENAAFIRKNRRIKILPNLFAEIGIFLLSNR